VRDMRRCKRVRRRTLSPHTTSPIQRARAGEDAARDACRLPSTHHSPPAIRRPPRSARTDEKDFLKRSRSGGGEAQRAAAGEEVAADRRRRYAERMRQVHFTFFHLCDIDSARRAKKYKRVCGEVNFLHLDLKMALIVCVTRECAPHHHCCRFRPATKRHATPAPRHDGAV